MTSYVLTPPEASKGGGYVLTPPGQAASASNALTQGAGGSEDLPEAYAMKPEALEEAKSGAKNVALGALKGASDIGATILRPVDALIDAATGKTRPTLSTLVSGEKPKTTNEERKAALAGFFKDNAEPESSAFKGGEIGADVAGTAGIGGAISKIRWLAEYAPKLAAAIESGGFKIGGKPAETTAEKAVDMGTRVAGGAITGAASAGAIDPNNADTGAVIGGALPPGVKAAGAAGAAVANAVLPKVSPEVRALYDKAKSLGIEIPIDRLVNSKPLNAFAASLNYVPLSGRTATEDAMASSLFRAVSRTFGQDSPNITQALRKADQSLGDKFELTLKRNNVKVDDELLTDLATGLDRTKGELSEGEAKIIGNQIDSILGKVRADGTIDGQTAYNLKKTLDRIGRRNSNEAFYATDLKKSLMAALNRSLGGDEAAAFAKVRQQYGNMLEIEKLAQNGAEGGVSVGRLANLKNINNQDLQDLADIAAQFVKGRENPHGAAQRVFVPAAVGGATGVAAGPAVLAGAAAAGRGANMALNSDTLKKLILDRPAVREGMMRIGELAPLRALIYRSKSSP